MAMVDQSDPAYRFVIAANEKESRNEARRRGRKPAHPALSIALGVGFVGLTVVYGYGANELRAIHFTWAFFGVINIWFGFRDLRKRRAAA
jgi:hypothetical protein